MLECVLTRRLPNWACLRRLPARRYYSMGPAALDWLPDDAGGPPPPNAGLGAGGRGGRRGAAGADRTEGASWTWCYPFHFAPLM